MPVTVPSTTTWKIENGKWVWYKDAKDRAVTPVGPCCRPSGGRRPPQSTDDAAGLPKNFRR